MSALIESTERAPWVPGPPRITTLIRRIDDLPPFIVFLAGRAYSSRLHYIMRARGEREPMLRAWLVQCARSSNRDLVRYMRWDAS